MSTDDLQRFKSVTFEDFRRLATDPTLSAHEKIGFPNAYREGKEQAIFEDICAKLPGLMRPGAVVLDIGPGCDALATLLIDHCRRHEQTLLLADSAEMLAQLPDEPFIQKYPGFYPRESIDKLRAHAGKVDVVLTYSVIHYVFRESCLYEFLDSSLGLLAGQGQMLIGDIPNISQRKRFFSSPTGVQFHQQFTGTTTPPPDTAFNRIELGSMDDAVIFSLLMRSRAAGFDAYVMPQRPDLPMANRREDILIRNP